MLLCHHRPPAMVPTWSGTTDGGRSLIMRSKSILVAAVIATLAGATACTENTRKGAGVGALVGAGAGLLGGGGIVRGAATGAAVGGAGGYVYDKVK